MGRLRRLGVGWDGCVLRVDRVEFGGGLREDRTVRDEGLEVLRRPERAVVRPRAPRAEEEREVGDDRCGRGRSGEKTKTCGGRGRAAGRGTYG